MLFATLDPTLRAVDLPHGARVILSDTVGFISELPTTLVAAFRATLEEVIEADIILHVRDVSHEDAEAQSGDVEDVLEELGVDPHAGRMIEVWNKIDRLPASEREHLLNLARRQATPPAVVSALTGEGIDGLKALIEDRIGARRKTYDVTLDSSDGAGASWLHRNAEVLDKSMADDGLLHMRVRVDAANAGLLLAKFGSERARPIEA
jgi:GTP-binding protein HflX